jgi:DNA (cytosine-5)-methyltransferase 1
MGKLKDVWIKSVKENKGRPRLYLDGRQAIRTGFAPGDKFEVEVEGKRLILTKKIDGSRTVSARTRGDKEYPVIDINSAELLKIFEGMDAVRLVVGEDKVTFLPLATEVQKRERLGRLKHKLFKKQPLLTGSLTHGAGILANAIHTGLQNAGVDTELAFANEIRDDMMLQAIETNDAWSENTAALAVPQQELAADEWLMSHLPKLEVLDFSLPCSGASLAGRAQRGGGHPEEHPEIGHLVVSALMIIQKTQPVFCLLENVTQYKTTASAAILRNQLRDMGYDLHEAILSGHDFGMLENRVRWCMVAVTRGIEFSFENLAPAVHVVRTLGEFIDRSIGEDDPRWRAVSYLKDKQERDREKGSNFKMQFLYEESTSVPVLRKFYWKSGSTDPRLVHPTNPELSRLLTPQEHARIKGILWNPMEGMSDSKAHELLGQSIVYDPFLKVGEKIGQAINHVAENMDEAEARLQESGSEVAARRERMTG